VKNWQSRWFDEKNLASLLMEDEKIRKYLNTRLTHAAVSIVEIERTPKKIVLIIHTARPGVVIGRRGQEVDRLRDELAQLIRSVREKEIERKKSKGWVIKDEGIEEEDEVQIKIEEIKKPELNAQLVADNIAFQLTQRISFRRAMKKSVTSAMRGNAKGIKIQCSGRLGGAEIARSEGYHEGRVPLHTLRADIDYARSTAHTTFGTIGIKVWIFKGEMLSDEVQGAEG
jgi:small subunit ribosomal protein S3